jgi:hypothetical protein
MFSFKRNAPVETLATLQAELEKSKQEREAARLGLMSAVSRLIREAQSFPLDEKVEMVAKDLAAVRRDEDVRS